MEIGRNRRKGTVILLFAGEEERHDTATNTLEGRR